MGTAWFELFRRSPPWETIGELEDLVEKIQRNGLLLH